MDKIIWFPLQANMTDWVYSGKITDDVERQCIGHLRGDFGRSGDEFWTSWFDHLPEFHTEAFTKEFQKIVNDLRKKGRLLHSMNTMRKLCREEESLQIDESYCFMTYTDRYLYCLRCIPLRGNYNFYLYCYDREDKEEK